MGLAEKKPMVKEGLWLTKDNKLILMKGNMTANSYKLTNFILWKATQVMNPDKPMIIHAHEILEACKIKTNDYSKMLDVESGKVMETRIEIRYKNKGGVNDKDDSSDWRKINIISDMSYNNGVITVLLNHKILEFIIGLKKNFTQSDYLQINSCSTYAAMRLYEVCNSWYWTKEKKAQYHVDTWRKLLGATKPTYEVFSAFKRYVIEPAIKIVNKNTDLDLTPEYIKSGRKTTSIIFWISKKNNKLTTNTHFLSEENHSPNENDFPDTHPKENTVFSLEERDVIRIMMTDFKQSKKNAESYIKNYGVEYCKEQIKYIRQEKQHRTINRIGGYFRKAIEQDYAGKNLSLINAAEAEAAAHKEKVEWNKDIKKHGVIPDLDEEELVQSILEEHEELVKLYRSLNIPDENIARWIEKYPEVLLFKIGLRMQGENGITVDFIDAMLNANANVNA